MEQKKHNCLLLTINIIGFIVSVAVLIISYFMQEIWWQSMLIALSINLITSLLVLNFVNRLLDSQAEKRHKKELKRKERELILNYHQIIETLIPIYVLEFNQLTIPISERTKDNKFLPIDSKTFNDSYGVKDLCDFASTDIFPFSTMGENIISAYKIALKKLEGKFETMLTITPFEFYPSIREILKQLITESMLPNGIDTLNLFCQGNNKKQLLPTIIQMIKDYNGNPLDDYNNNKYSGNLFLNVIHLYVHLGKTKKLIEQYLEEIEKIKEEDGKILP